MHRPALVTPPATTPVTLAEAKAHLRVDFDDDDVRITSLIQSAVNYLDGWTGILGRSLVEQTWQQDFDTFSRCLAIPLVPVFDIVSVTWRDGAGAESTVDPADYSLQTDAGGKSAVRLNADFIFPSDLAETAAISVTYKAGYPTVADVSTVPAAIKQAMLLMIGNWYENREEVVIGASAVKLPSAADALLASYRPWRV